jgi:transcriptional regulator with XRE-family HTH domain
MWDAFPDMTGSSESTGDESVRADPPAEPDPDAQRLAERLSDLRTERGWSLQDLAERTGISRSTLSRAERGEISPTVAALTRLAAAYDRSLSALLAEVEAEPRSLVRTAEQAVTRDEGSGWRRRIVSPPFPGLRGQLAETELAPGADVSYDPPSPGAEQHLWLIAGMIEFTESPAGESTVDRSVAGQPAPRPAARPAPPAPEPPAAPPGSVLERAAAIRTGSAGAAPAGEVTAREEGAPSTGALHASTMDKHMVDPDAVVLVRGDCLRLRLWGQARLRCLSPEPARFALFTVPP